MEMSEELDDQPFIAKVTRSRLTSQRYFVCGKIYLMKANCNNMPSKGYR